MTTASMHAEVRRNRFAHHAFSAISALIPTFLRLPLTDSVSAPPRSASEKAAYDAHQVRELASSYARTDPGFAADLYAAAARHEGLYED